MQTQDYPKTIPFETCNPTGLTKDAQNWISRLKKEVKITLLAENILNIEYPSDIVKEIRTVNVDDLIYRLDFIAPEDRFFNCGCIFPDIPWNNRAFMQNRWINGVRKSIKGNLTLTYPVSK